jgi:glycosyltransferase involved in cell wall biosynthesis
VPDFDNLLKDSRIKLIGLSTDVPELIQSCDAVLFPALKTHFPRPLIEGMAMKKMSLAFDIDGIEEVIKDQQNGLIIRDKTSRGLANGINELASMSKDRHSEMSEFGYQFARTNFSTENIKQITSIYDQL